MLDHIGVRVRDYPRLLAFYRAALAPIGYDVLMEFPGTAGLGADGKPDLWLMQTEQPLNPTHVAFTSDRPRVDAFYAAAMAAGGADNGPPGVRADYHPHYYAAFVRDPEGNNIEVVCHADPAAPKPAPARAAAKRAARKPAKSVKAAGKKTAKRPPVKSTKSSKPSKSSAKKKRR